MENTHPTLKIPDAGILHDLVDLGLPMGSPEALLAAYNADSCPVDEMLQRGDDGIRTIDDAEDIIPQIYSAARVAVSYGDLQQITPDTAPAQVYRFAERGPLGPKGPTRVATQQTEIPAVWRDTVTALLRERYDFKERLETLRRESGGDHVEDGEAEADADVYSDERDVCSPQYFAGYGPVGAGHGQRMSLATTVRDRNVSLLRDDMALGLAMYLRVCGRQKRFVFDYRGPKEARKRLLLMRVLEASPRIFEHLKFSAVLKDNVALALDYPIGLEALHDLLQQNQNGLECELETLDGRPACTIVRDGTDVLVVVTRHTIAIPYVSLMAKPDKLIRALRLATRIVEVIHQDQIFADDFKIIDMAQRRPVLDALLGVDERHDFRNLADVIWNGRTAPIGKNTPYHEIQRSLKRRDAVAARDESAPLPPQIIRVKPDVVPYPEVTQEWVLITRSDPAEVLMDIQMRFDADAARKVVERRRLQVTVDQDRDEPTRYRGGVREIRKIIHRIREAGGDTNRLLMSFDTGSVKIVFATRAELGRSLEVLDVLLSAGVFTTATESVKSIRAGLTPTEAYLMPVIDLMISLYNIFIRPSEERKALWRAGPNGVVQKTPEADEWLVRVASEVTADPSASTPVTQRRLLHLLKTMANRIDEGHVYMRDSYVSSKYENLRAAIRALEAGESPPVADESGDEEDGENKSQQENPDSRDEF